MGVLKRLKLNPELLLFRVVILSRKTIGLQDWWRQYDGVAANMLRDVLSKILSDYPTARAEGAKAYAGHPVARFVRQEAPQTVHDVSLELPLETSHLLAKGSAGASTWATTPWLALLDARETRTPQEGVYLVYLFSSDGADAYLTINQGCTTLYHAQTKRRERSTAEELRRRAAVMRTRLPNRNRLRLDAIELRGASWLSRLYEAGTVSAVRYHRDRLPTEEGLQADLIEALASYDMLVKAGTWVSDDTIIQDADDDGMAASLVEARVYRLHRRLERSSSNANKVKRALGTRCMACDLDMAEHYGELGRGYIEAHHLKPLSSYAANETIELDPRNDFAVLCPNCHRMIHRMDDTGNVNGLRQTLANERGRSNDES